MLCFRLPASVLLWVWIVLPGVARAGSSTDWSDASRPATLAWHTLPPLPVPLGLSGAAAGVSNDALILAGGTNFPDGPTWEGGSKRFYDDICVLEDPAGQWKKLDAKLPHALGYSVALSTSRGVLIAGGADADQHFDEVFLLRWEQGRIVNETLPSLPAAMSNMAGAAVGDVVYLAGGIETPTATQASKQFISLDLSNPDAGWKQLESWPGPARMLAVAGVQEGDFFLMSGAALHAGPDAKPVRDWLRDAYRYSPAHGWRKIADLPRPAVAAPSPALPIGPAHLFVIGGDDGVQVNEPPASHTGFPKTALAYHAVTDTWATMEEIPVAPVTTPVIRWRERYIIAGGEVRPCVRMNNVYAIELTSRRSAFGVVNYLALIGYLLAMVGIGVYFARRNKSTDEFFRGGQRIPWWAAGLSIYATMLSSLSYMAIPAKAYAADWTFTMNSLAILLAAPIVIYLYLPFYRQLNVTSAYEYLERRFNYPVRAFGSIAFILLQLGRMAIVLYLPALALATVSSVDIFTSIVLMGVLCVLYTVMGGIEAVIWTDVVQSLVLILGALLAFVLVLMRIDGGIWGFFETANANAKFFQDATFTWDTASATLSIVLVGSLISNLIPYTAQQDVVQRYMTTSDEKEARKSIWINAIVSVPSAVMFFALGTAFFAFYSEHPERLDPTLQTDAVFPQFMLRELPMGIAGLVVAGVFAAAQSTLSSSLNSVATAYVTDFHQRLQPASTDRQRLTLARWVTALVGLIAVGSACLIATVNVQSLWDVFIGMMGLAGGGLAGLFALGIFTRRANGPGALIGAGVSAIVLYLVQRYTAVNFFLFGGIGIITCVIVGYATSLLIPAKPRDLAGLTIYTARSGAARADQDHPDIAVAITAKE